MLGLASNEEQTLAEESLSGNQYLGDEKLHVKFYIEAIENPTKSKKEGRPIFEDTEMVLIVPPGDKDNTVIAPARNYADRFRSRYNAWKAGQDQDAVIGTPLKEWPGGPSASQVKELAFFEVRTVEQLAGVSDGNLQSMGPGYLLLRQKAQKYLEASHGAASAEKVQAELAKRDAEIEVLKRALKEQNEQIKRIQAQQDPESGPRARKG